MEVKLLLPEPVAIWFAQRAAQNFKPRATYICDMLNELYRKANAE